VGFYATNVNYYPERLYLICPFSF